MDPSSRVFSRVDAAIYIINCVGKANVSRQSLVEAIATLEVQRVLTGNDRELNRAVDTVLQVLRDKLAQIQAEPGDQKRPQLSVLVADLSGFTALSERMDVERVREAINAMWAVLDAVIYAWGGQIDQHAGDSLMALFGLPHPRQGDAARALYAALAMQQELALFNERARRAAVDPFDESWVGDWPGPDMRIGVHSGPVYFAHAPGARDTTGRPTAVGETVVEARYLEKVAPAGQVLTSADTRRQALSRFYFAPLPGAATADDDTGYLVSGERPLPTGYEPGAVAGQITRFIGRTELLDQLEVALEAAADSRTPHLVTIVGAPGAGKSRLVHEFEKQATLLSGSPTILRAGTQGAFPDFPYALVRDLLLRRFSILPQHSRYLIEHRLRLGLMELAADQSGTAHGEPTALDFTATMALLEKLLDARTAAAIPVEEVQAVLTQLMQAITANGPAIVVLEGINRADRESLELVDRLVRDEAAGPLLFLGLATVAGATDPQMMLPWFGRGGVEDIFSPIERLDVPPLSAVDSRLLATEILSPLSPAPMRLIDLVVAESGGNPLYIESFARLLIEQGVISTGERWSVDMDRLEKAPLPTNLDRLLDAQLAHLTAPERIVLRYAAVFGPLCWDTALLELIPASEAGEGGVEAAILSLGLKGYLAGDDLFSIRSSQAYAFRRDSVREAAYAATPPAERRRLHQQVANWLIANQDNARLSRWFSIDAIIARHLAEAGDAAQAETWRQHAGMPILR